MKLKQLSIFMLDYVQFNISAPKLLCSPFNCIHCNIFSKQWQHFYIQVLGFHLYVKSKAHPAKKKKKKIIYIFVSGVMWISLKLPKYELWTIKNDISCNKWEKKYLQNSLAEKWKCIAWSWLTLYQAKNHDIMVTSWIIITIEYPQ